MDRFGNMDKEWPGRLLRYWCIRRNMFGLLVPVVLAGNIIILIIKTI